MTSVIKQRLTFPHIFLFSSDTKKVSMKFIYLFILSIELLITKLITWTVKKD